MMSVGHHISLAPRSLRRDVSSRVLFHVVASLAVFLLWGAAFWGCTGEEVNGCVNSQECGAGEVCVSGACEPEVCSCTPDNQQVCGVDGVTYSNACQAACAGVSVSSLGICAGYCQDNQECPQGFRCNIGEVCLSPSDVDTDPGIGAPSVCYGLCVEEGCGCIAHWDPVCGIDGHTYGNECEANCAGVAIVSYGECFLCPAYACAMICPGGYVLDSDGCPTCECATLFCSVDGDCPSGMLCDPTTCVPSCPACPDCNNVCVEAVECSCSADDSPVCGVDGETYRNACVAACYDVDILHNGGCDPACEPLLECTLECPSGFARDEQGCPECACQYTATLSCTDSRDCGPGEWCNPQVCVPSCPDCMDCMPACDELPCDCPDATWAPVCDESGWTYASSCEAECAGVLSAHIGLCGEGFCTCASEWVPVCGGDGVTYSNRCNAECVSAEIVYEGACECMGLCFIEGLVCGTDFRDYTCGVEEAACNGVDVRWLGTCDAPILCAGDEDCGPTGVCDPGVCAPSCVGCVDCNAACVPAG